MAMNSNVTNLVQESVFVPYMHRPETYIVSGLFLIILIVGVFGNGMMMITLGADSTARNTSTVYMFSLALGDILVILTSVPLTSVIFTFDSWPWGQTVCKLSECVKDISVGVSVFTLTALSAERYYAVVNPLRRHVAGMKAVPLALLIACLIWVLAIVLSMPAALFSDVMDIDITTNSSIHICNPFPVELGASYRRGVVLFKFLAYYIIPLLIISVFYFQIVRHLQLSTRNMPCELSPMQRLEQIRSRRKVE
ncbi:neuropeptide CCHamide-1 receptor-like [Bombus affinis]|uniref:neuropeptide CCHamide-1 receptor-like n=1 Tax=Bombus affinis TaxID=309941 RepID=UPI0021B6F08A|nr:neuropeptide CCHamide-1 receptor-like [Bombus affinis]